jgi:hypothetical protein
VDADLRTAITAAAGRGGFVLVKGGSSVGKTRALFEAVRAVLPEWWLLHPADAAAVRAFGDAHAPRTVVWLDELHPYLDQPGGLPSGTVRAFLAADLVVGHVVAGRVRLPHRSSYRARTTGMPTTGNCSVSRGSSRSSRSALPSAGGLRTSPSATVGSGLLWTLPTPV